jgi:Cu/Ag efflux protein CusF
MGTQLNVGEAAMKGTPSSLPRAAWVVLAVAALSVACGAPATETGAEAASETSEPSGDRYTVRGLVVEPPDTDQARIRIQHETIPDFKGIGGNVWEGGMESMTMTFVVAEGVPLQEISAGDKVEFVLLVNWEKTPTQSITEIVNLPAETELDFGPETDDNE